MPVYTLLMMCYWYFDEWVNGLVPCRIVTVPIMVLLLAAVDGLWLIYRFIIYPVSAHGGPLLYCIVLVGFLLDWLSFWLVSIGNVSVKYGNIILCSL